MKTLTPRVSINTNQDRIQNPSGAMTSTSESKTLLDKIEWSLNRKKNETGLPGIKRIKVNEDEPLFPPTPPIQIDHNPRPTIDPSYSDNSLSMSSMSMTGFRRASQVTQQQNTLPIQSTPISVIDDVEEEKEDKESFIDILTRPKAPVSDARAALSRLLSSSLSSMDSEVESTLQKAEEKEPKSGKRDSDTLKPIPEEKMLVEKPMSQEKTGAVCIMCYDKKSENIMTSACGHLACKVCWENWLSIKSECPTCKKKVRAKQLIKIHF